MHAAVGVVAVVAASVVVVVAVAAVVVVAAAAAATALIWSSLIPKCSFSFSRACFFYTPKRC